MILNLKKQMEEQISAMKTELTKSLEPAFKDFKLDVFFNDTIDRVEVYASNESKPSENKTISNIITFFFDKSQNQLLVNSRSAIKYTDRMGEVIAVEVGSITLSFEVISYVYSMLMDFTNKYSQEDPTETKL